MANYTSQEQLQAVGKNCSQFRSAGIAATMSTGSQDVSCSICRNWDGQKCRINAYDNVAANLEIDQ